MDRRNFLATVLGASAAAVLWPQIEAFAASAPVAERESVTELETLRAIAREAQRMFCEEMAAAGSPVLPSQIDPNSILLSLDYPYQYGITLRNRGERDPSLRPAMQALAAKCLDVGAERYGSLSTHLPGAFAVSAAPLRLLTQYRIDLDEWMIRADVLLGVSEQGKRRAAARVLRARLKRDYAVNRLPPERWR